MHIIGKGLENTCDGKTTHMTSMAYTAYDKLIEQKNACWMGCASRTTTTRVLWRSLRKAMMLVMAQVASSALKEPPTH